MANVVIRNLRGRLAASGLRTVIVAGILVTSCPGGDEANRPPEKPLRYITEKEMTAIVEGSNQVFPAEPLTRKPSWSSARKMAQSYRGLWAFKALKMRQDARYRLVPPTLQNTEDRALAKWIAALESRSDSTFGYAVDTMSIYEIQSQALEKLFPEWTFLFVPYVIHLRFPLTPRDSARDSGGLDGPFLGILALKGGIVHACAGLSINNPFGLGYKPTIDFSSFVQSEGIRIRNETDAARFWDAYCSFHRLHWSSGKHMRVDGTLWRLNDKPAQPSEQVLEVGTDSDGKILRMKLIEPDTPKEPQKKK